MKCRTSGRVIVVLALLLSALLACRAQAAEQVEELIVGVDLEQLLSATLEENVSTTEFSIHSLGVYTYLRKNGKHLGHVSIAVVADRKAAGAILDQYLSLSAPHRRPQKDLAGKIGEVCAVWPDSGSVFQRCNVTVSLNVSSGHAELERFARAVDGALIAGTHGVRKGAAVPVPRILSIDLPEKVVAGTTVPIKVRIGLPLGANGDRLLLTSRARSTGSYAPQEVELVSTIQYQAMGSEAYEIPYWVCYTTSGCVVASKKIIIKVVAK